MNPVADSEFPEFGLQSQVFLFWFTVDLQSENRHLQPSGLDGHLQLSEEPFFG